MTATRNDPCPCGSGRKYKHCCLGRQSTTPADSSAALWRRVRSGMESHPARMRRFVLEVYGACAFEEAWGAFGRSDPDWPELETDNDLAAIFLPWMYHAWTPDPDVTEVANTRLHGVPPTRAWLAQKGRHADREVVRYLEGCLRERFSFHEVLACDPGVSFVARDLWSDSAAKVLESTASRTLRAGDMIYAQMVPVGDFWMMESCAPQAFPPGARAAAIARVAELIAEREPTPMSASAIRQNTEDDALRAHYVQLLQRRQQATELRNTDGDPIAPQTLQFRVASPAEAFDRLAALDVVASGSKQTAAPVNCGEPDEFIAGFDWSRDGNALGPAWDNTVLGRFEIAGHTLTLTVNSDARADEGRRLVEQALGDAVEYLDTEREPMPAPRGGAQLTLTTTALGTMDADEAQQVLAGLLARHYANWPDTALPALNGRTPMEAVADPTGRAMVAALVDQIERGTVGRGPQVPREVIAYLRERLRV